MNVIGCDPGLSGAFALVSDDGRLLELLDMPTITVRSKKRIEPTAILDWLIAVGEVGLIAIEEVGGRGMGAVSAFSFGQGYGMAQGLFVALCRPWATVTPQTWTRVMGVGADKGFHRQMAMRLFPSSADKFERVKDDGRADAVLIATYAMRNLAFATRAS